MDQAGANPNDFLSEDESKLAVALVEDRPETAWGQWKLHYVGRFYRGGRTAAAIAAFVVISITNSSDNNNNNIIIIIII